MRSNPYSCSYAPALRLRDYPELNPKLRWQKPKWVGHLLPAYFSHCWDQWRQTSAGCPQIIGPRNNHLRRDMFTLSLQVTQIGWRHNLVSSTNVGKENKQPIAILPNTHVKAILLPLNYSLVQWKGTLRAPCSATYWSATSRKRLVLGGHQSLNNSTGHSLKKQFWAQRGRLKTWKGEGKKHAFENYHSYFTVPSNGEFH